MMSKSLEILELKSIISTLKTEKDVEIEIIEWCMANGYLYPMEKKKKYFLNSDKEKLHVKIRSQYIKSNNKCNDILAYDTETFEGKCKLICRNDGKSILNPSFKECLDFLFYLANNSNTYRFFFNIDFDVSAILKLWKSKKSKVRDKWILQKINWLSKGISIRYKDYMLTWIKGRIFVIKNIKRKKAVKFTDLNVFFHKGLDEISKKYLNEAKKGNIDGNKLNTDINYWNKNLEAIKEYCIIDCKLTWCIAFELIRTIIYKCKLPLPKYLVSFASLSKQYFRKNCFIPNLSQVPEKIIQIAYNSYYGGRFDTLKRGTFKKLYLYDIVSQYPSFIKELCQLRNGLWKIYTYIWKNSKEIPKKECFGFFDVELEIPSDIIIPSIAMKDKGINIFPCGYIRRWMTWYDVDLMRDYIIKVHEGYIFEKAPCNYKPFEKAIDNLFASKSKVNKKTHELKYNIFKLTMNAVYGCFIESHFKEYILKEKELHAGIMFNPIYASQITAFGRWSVIKDIPIKEHKHIVAIHTDSIITDKPMDKYLNIGIELGKWSVEKEGKGLSLTTGMYQIDDIVKTRGIPKEYIVNWFDFFEKHSKEKCVEFQIPHMKKIREALVQDKNLDKVNTFVNYKRSVRATYNNKRSWNKDFKNFGQILTTNYGSLPHTLYKDDSIVYTNEICSQHRWNESKPLYKIRLDKNGKEIKLKLNKNTGLYEIRTIKLFNSFKETFMKETDIPIEKRELLLIRLKKRLKV